MEVINQKKSHQSNEKHNTQPKTFNPFFTINQNIETPKDRTVEV